MGEDTGQGRYRFKPLLWDSDFFGIKSARLDLLAELSEDEFRSALALTEGYEFVGIANQNCCVENARMIAKHTDAFVADTNVQFVEEVHFQENADCRNYNHTVNQVNREGLIFQHSNNHPYSDDLIAMAASIYTTSRFVKDERLAARNGKSVYAEWVKSAFNKENKYYITCMDQSGHICGFLLYSLDSGVVTVELVGVSPRLRRKGIGKDLWTELEKQALVVSALEIHVGTQITNIKAIGLYMSMGCRMRASNQIYHWWK